MLLQHEIESFAALYGDHLAVFFRFLQGFHDGAVLFCGKRIELVGIPVEKLGRNFVAARQSITDLDKSSVRAGAFLDEPNFHVCAQPARQLQSKAAQRLLAAKIALLVAGSAIGRRDVRIGGIEVARMNRLQISFDDIDRR